MDEQLIEEVAQHGVIYNRQKYYLNGSSNGGAGGANKYETKDEAWQTIAVKLHSDVETCKKRWKYLRERYVSQRKQGDPPVYEHLSRPYLEKMKFLDQHIQPRKSYRNVPSFLTSPHSANSSNYSEYNMDSKSNSSIKAMGHFGNAAQHPYHAEQPHTLSQSAVTASALEAASVGQVKIEADQAFRDFAAAVASQQLQQISQSQIQQHQVAAVAAAIADSSQNYQEHLVNGNGCSGIASSSSGASMKSPMSSPIANGILHSSGVAGHSTSTPTAQQAVVVHSSCSNSAQLATHDFNDTNTDDLDAITNNNFHMKKPRVQLSKPVQNGHNSNHNHHNNNNNGNTSQFSADSDDDSDENSTSMLHPQALLNDHPENHFNALASTSTAAAAALQQQRSNNNNGNAPQQPCMFASNADFLFQLYQQQTTTQQQQLNKFQVPQSPPQRSSEHLLGELVTTELLKMSKERRRHAQKRILEILFFED